MVARMIIVEISILELRKKIILALAKFNSVKQVFSALIKNNCGRKSCTNDSEVLQLSYDSTDK